MTTKREKRLAQIEYEWFSLRKARAELATAKTKLETLSAWGDFVDHFRKCSDLLLKVGLSWHETERVASGYRKEMDKDTILRFLYYSRNREQHPDDEDDNLEFVLLGDEVPPTADVPFVGRVAPGSQVYIGNCVINGQHVDGGLDWGVQNAGPISWGNLPYQLNPGRFYLHPVKTAAGKPIPVPEAPHESFGKEYIHFAEHATQWLFRVSQGLEIGLSLGAVE